MANNQVNQERLETLGPVERTIQALTQATDHLYHGRPGMVVKDDRTTTKVRWEPVIWKEEEGKKVVYRQKKVGKKTEFEKVGTLGEDNQIRENRHIVGEYRDPGLNKEVSEHFYKQVADIWKLDNDFAAHLASWAFNQDHRDLKILLAALMLVQNRSGEPVKEQGKVAFYDEDYRAVGEAMCLQKGQYDINPKMLLRIGQLLESDNVAKANHDLGFGKSARDAFLGRYRKAVTAWLKYRETNPRVLEGLVKAGFRTTVMALCRKVGYKPETSKFFEVLRWKQKQAKDGRRTLAIGVEVSKAESWEGLTEEEICNKIIKDKPNYKRIMGMLPVKMGLTKAIVAAAIEAGSVSDADLIILTPTLEDLGLLQDADVKARWEKATQQVENQRALNIAKRVKKQDTVEKLEKAAETASKKALEEVTRGLRIYCMVDISGSLQISLDVVKQYLPKLLQGFPLDRLHVSVFNTMGREVKIKSATAAGVENAFKGFSASGGTIYGTGLIPLLQYKPTVDEDALCIFVGDQMDHGPAGGLTGVIRQSGLNPVGFGMLHVRGTEGDGNAVERTAIDLNIPCFRISEEMFNDPYSVTRVLRNLIATTPVGKVATPGRVQRKTLIQQILETPLLQKPVWAVK